MAVTFTGVPSAFAWQPPKVTIAGETCTSEGSTLKAGGQAVVVAENVENSVPAALTSTPVLVWDKTTLAFHDKATAHVVLPAGTGTFTVTVSLKWPNTDEAPKSATVTVHYAPCPTPSTTTSTSTSTTQPTSTTSTSMPVTSTTPPSSVTPVTTTSTPTVYYSDCAAVQAAGAAPIYAGQPGYRPALDGDSDGVACEIQRATLPETGSPWTLRLTVLGLVLVAGGVLLVARARRLDA